MTKDMIEILLHSRMQAREMDNKRNQSEMNKQRQTLHVIYPRADVDRLREIKPDAMQL